MKIVIGVVLARCPRASAGHTCATMNWALSFRELGHDVWITEHIDGKEIEPPEAPGLASPQEEFWKATAREFGFEGRECLIVNGASPELDAFREFASTADAFFNYSGQFKRLDLLGPQVRKVYLDLDPGFTQLWVEAYGSDMNFEGHDVFVTIGTNINNPSALIPHAGREWITTVPPVTSAWATLPAVPPPGDAAWTTIGHWYGYGDLQWQGRLYAGKRESLLAMRELPRSVARPCVIATDLKREWGDYDEFLESGWKFRISSEVCRDVPTYLQFIRDSRGELGIAKAGYVVSNGGWLSDRSLVYLSLGRPVLLQDTGWPNAVPSTLGLVPFQNAGVCVELLREIDANYQVHSAAALDLARSTFSPEGVLSPLLARVL